MSLSSRSRASPPGWWTPGTSWARRRVVLDVQEKSRKFRLWFSGDIGRRKLPLLRDPVLPEKVDYLMMESTYGDKPHRDPQMAFDELREVVLRTVKRGGKVIIPAFAVGRTQELVYGLHQMIDSGDLPRIPVIVDSPLAVNASDVFRAHPECFDEETQAFIRSDRHHSALGFDLLTYTRSVEESKALNTRTDPMIIISASGMCEAGRILHHLRNNIENPTQHDPDRFVAGPRTRWAAAWPTARNRCASSVRNSK